MTAGQLLRSKGRESHSRAGGHPLWSKDGCEPMELSKALEVVHADTADGFEARIRAERRAMLDEIAEDEAKGAAA